eukprot:Pgem_evm1s11605
MVSHELCVFLGEKETDEDGQLKLIEVPTSYIIVNPKTMSRTIVHYRHPLMPELRVDELFKSCNEVIIENNRKKNLGHVGSARGGSGKLGFHFEGRNVENLKQFIPYFKKEK